MEGIRVTLGEVLLFESKLPPGVYLLWENESSHPVYIGKSLIRCDQRLIEHWQGGRYANRELNAAMHLHEPYCLDWIVEVYPLQDMQNAGQLEKQLLEKFTPLLS